MEKFIFRSLLLLCVVSVALILAHEGHTCLHDSLDVKSIKSASTQYAYSNKRSLEQRAADRKSIRITLDTTRLDTTKQLDSNYTCYRVGQIITDQNSKPFTCQSGDILTAQKSAFAVNNLLKAAVDRLQAALLVDPVVGNLKVDTRITSCYSGSNTPLIVPDSLKTVGIENTDLLVFVTARHISKSSVLAFASECQHDTINRATVGFINFDPANLASLIDDSYGTKLGATMHEMSHVLGYSSGKYDQFVDSTGKAIPKSQVILYEKDGSRTITKIHSPTVLQTVRNHFDCQSLTGAEIENQGENGTAYSHWEKRTFGNEYLVGTTTDAPVLSNFTLAYFQDSGWYDVNYTASDPLLWGYQAGCSFATGRCNTWTAENYFCNQTTASIVGCTFDRAARAPCNLVTNLGTLDTAYQYFKDPSWGGADVFADYCPYVQSSANNGAIYCSDTSRQGSSYVDTGENYCSSCKCFETTLAGNSPSPLTVTNLGCYNVTCTSKTALKVQVGQLWYDCPKSGTLDSPGIYAGVLNCPKSNVLCAGARDDNTWPVFESIDPVRGTPGTLITITGRNFVKDMIVVVDEPCTGCTFVSNTTYTCNIAPQSAFTNPKHLLGSRLDVEMSYPDKSKSVVGIRAFLLKETFADGVIGQLGGWVKSNPIISTMVIILAFFGILICCYCCWIEFKKASTLGERLSKQGTRDDTELREAPRRPRVNTNHSRV